MWTEQAVETLRRLALEGRSAAWIAAALGAPSRNAVIGKANRIGIRLNGALRSGPFEDLGSESPPRPEAPWGRPDPASRVRRPRSAETTHRARQAIVGNGPRSGKPRSPEQDWERAVPFSLKRISSVSHDRKRAERWIFASAEVGEMRRIGFAEIGELQCRWPLGDPMEEDFAYCGLQVANGRSYCAGHCRLAYRRPTEQVAKGI